MERQSSNSSYCYHYYHTIIIWQNALPGINDNNNNCLTALCPGIPR